MKKNLEFEIKGYWWLPGKSETKFFGEINYRPGEGYVLTASELDPTLFDEHKPSVDIIHGRTFRNEDITLVDCYLIDGSKMWRSDDKKLYEGKYDIDVIIVGHFFKSLDEIKLHNYSVHYPYLTEWLGLSGFDDRRKPGDDVDIIIRYKRHELIIIHSTEDLQISFGYGCATSYAGKHSSRAYIDQTCAVCFQSKKTIPFSVFRQKNRVLKYLLSFCIGKPLRSESIEGYLENVDVESKTKSLKIYFNEADAVIHTGLSYYEMPILYEDVTQNISILVETWFKKYMQYTAILDEYFSSLYNQHIYLEHLFLSMIRVVESYHRVLNLETAVTPQHKLRLKGVFSSVLEEHKEWLQEKLQFSHEPSLKQRLEDIVNKLRNQLLRITGTTEYPFSKIVRTRNYLTHFDPSLKSKAATGGELYKISQILKKTFELCFLYELGFSKDQIDDLLKKRKEYWILRK